jgi:hypothetical protein
MHRNAESLPIVFIWKIEYKFRNTSQIFEKIMLLLMMTARSCSLRFVETLLHHNQIFTKSTDR